MRKGFWLVVATLILGAVTSAHALDAEQKCLAGRAKARGNYQACIQKAFAKLPSASYIGGDDFAKFAKCVDKYAAAWTKLSGLEGSTSCSGLARFVDNGSTVTDRLTLLTWEKKTGSADFIDNYSDRHEVDNLYALTFDNDDDGSAYSDFLRDLNSGTGFADANSWRLPTVAELLTILGQADIGTVGAGWYWSTTPDQTNTGQAWRIHFGDSIMLTTPKWGVNYTRAVRGGL